MAKKHCEQIFLDNSENKNNTFTINGENNKKLVVKNRNNLRCRKINLESISGECNYQGKNCDYIIEVYDPKDNIITSVYFVEFKGSNCDDAYEQISETAKNRFIAKRYESNPPKRGVIITTRVPRPIRTKIQRLTKKIIKETGVVINSPYSNNYGLIEL